MDENLIIVPFSGVGKIVISFFYPSIFFSVEEELKLYNSMLYSWKKIYIFYAAKRFVGRICVVALLLLLAVQLVRM